MKLEYPVKIAAIVLLLSSSTHAQSLPKKYDPSRDPVADLKQALVIAKKTNKNILVDIGGDWCIDCRRLDLFFKTNPDIYSSLTSSFTFFKAYAGSEKDNSEFFSYLPEIHWVPSFILISPKGKILRVIDTREFSSGSTFSKIKFTDFISKNGKL